MDVVKPDQSWSSATWHSRVMDKPYFHCQFWACLWMSYLCVVKKEPIDFNVPKWPWSWCILSLSLNWCIWIAGDKTWRFSIMVWGGTCLKGMLWAMIHFLFEIACTHLLYFNICMPGLSIRMVLLLGLILVVRLLLGLKEVRNGRLRGRVILGNRFHTLLKEIGDLFLVRKFFCGVLMTPASGCNCTKFLGVHEFPSDL